MLFASLLLIVLSVSFAQAQMSTYLLDASCLAHPKADQAVREAVAMAKNAVTRINDASDQVTERLFQTVFKRSRAQGGEQRDIFNSIGAFTNLLSDLGVDIEVIRIFCDNDSRWVKQGDYMYDEASRISIKRVPSCVDPKKTTLASTYKDIRGVNRRGSSITLCNEVLDRDWATVDMIRGGNPNKNLASARGKTINQYNFISRTVLHEFTHTKPINRKDVKKKNVLGEDIKGSPYKWENIFEKNQQDSALNADNYAYFGLISYLTGHKLSEDPTERAEGKIVREASIAKRMAPAKCRDLTSRRVDPDCGVQ